MIVTICIGVGLIQKPRQFLIYRKYD